MDTGVSDQLTVGAVAHLVGVSVRTLHHWDEIGLVTPSARTPGGYRSYSSDDVSRIHRVLVYRELGFGLAAVSDLLDDPDIDEEQHLREQRRLLDERIASLQRMAEAVDRVLQRKTPGTALSVEEQAEIFGHGWREDWADEARSRWGDSDQWRQFEENVAAYTAEERATIADAGQALHEEIADAMRAGVAPSSVAGIALAERHRAMIGSLYDCTPSMHTLLGRMYVEDPRFRETLDHLQDGMSVWLRDAIYAAARTNGADPTTARWE